MNISQQKALNQICKTRFSLVQGPPGTGKTKLLSAIVAFMYVQSAEHILVCANQNETADLLYEALDKIPMLSQRIIRVYPKKKIEDTNTVFMKNSYHKVFEA